MKCKQQLIESLSIKKTGKLESDHFFLFDAHEDAMNNINSVLH